MSRPFAERLAIPGVLALVAFLAFTSPILFLRIDPGPLRLGESATFGGGVFSLLLCYFRSAYVNPGAVPRGWSDNATATDSHRPASTVARKWCRKCEAWKPPRAHHCKVCGRCIPKMDHHCPWTSNCVSHRTMPHFVRFLFYCVVTMAYLEKLLFTRIGVLWQNRKWPSYLGPSAFQLTHLFLLIVTNSVTLLGLFILFVRVIWCIGANTTTIEGWEIDRHKVLLRRARALGGQLPTANGDYIRIVKQEFPYDVGVWKNVCQSMGTGNPLAWFWPLAASLPLNSGLEFEVNGFEDPDTVWPPPDPDRRIFSVPKVDIAGGGQYTDQDIDGFKQRQQQDLQRHSTIGGSIVRRRPFHERYSGDEQAIEGSSGGEESWRNNDGERLADFGVDEDIDFYDEDEDIPLAELIARRRQA